MEAQAAPCELANYSEIITATIPDAEPGGLGDNALMKYPGRMS